MPNILEDIDIDLELDETDDQLMLWKKKENI